jgi:hypothetical protein
MRYLLAMEGMALICLRIVFPWILIDEITIVFFSIIAIVLLIPDIGGLIHRVQKFKLGGVELEIGERIQKLAENTESYAAKLKVPADTAQNGPSDELLERVFAPGADPRSSLILISLEIDKTVRRIADRALPADPHRSRPYSTTQQLRELVDAQAIDMAILRIYREFWGIRTRIKYDSDASFAANNIYWLLDQGVRLLRILKHREQRLIAGQ